MNEKRVADAIKSVIEQKTSYQIISNINFDVEDKELMFKKYKLTSAEFMGISINDILLSENLNQKEIKAEEIRDKIADDYDKSKINYMFNSKIGSWLSSIEYNFKSFLPGINPGVLRKISTPNKVNHHCDFSHDFIASEHRDFENETDISVIYIFPKSAPSHFSISENTVDKEWYEVNRFGNLGLNENCLASLNFKDSTIRANDLVILNTRCVHSLFIENSNLDWISWGCFLNVNRKYKTAIAWS